MSRNCLRILEDQAVRQQEVGVNEAVRLLRCAGQVLRPSQDPKKLYVVFGHQSWGCFGLVRGRRVIVTGLGVGVLLPIS